MRFNSSETVFMQRQADYLLQHDFSFPAGQYFIYIIWARCMKQREVVSGGRAVGSGQFLGWFGGLPARALETNISTCPLLPESFTSHTPSQLPMLINMLILIPPHTTGFPPCPENLEFCHCLLFQAWKMHGILSKN